MKRKSERRRLMQQIDLLVRDRVFARDGWQCVKCGSVKNLQAAHIMPKGRYQRLRFEECNILTLCLGCHIFGAHRDPVGFIDWLEQKYPGKIQTLKEMAAMSRRVDMKELLIVLNASN